MKRNLHRFAPSVLAFIGLCLLGGVAQAQDRFIIRARDVDAITNAELRMLAVAIDGEEPYQQIDRVTFGENLIARRLTPEQAATLQGNRPDLIIEPDRLVEPNAGAGNWSPDRIDQRLGNDGVYSPTFLHACGAHRPFVYVCDTGVLSTHSEFVTPNGRVSFAGSYIPALLNRTIPAFQDPYDHGTAVAACAVGQQTGSGRGPAAIVSAVCYPDPGVGAGGTFASFAADVIYWSLNEHLLRGLDADPYNDASVLVFASSTVNGPSAILDLAIERARLGGMMVVVSAGNNNMDAGTTSPAGAAGAGGDITLTVAASTIGDARWVNSNYGPLVELFAPGDNVLCASSLGPNLCALRNGTSFSAGYVAGAAARILARNPWATPNEVSTILTDQTDPQFGPSGPFGAGVNGVPKLLYVNPNRVPNVGQDFPTWLVFHGINDPDPQADSDGDSLSNTLEYFLGRDPNTSNPPSERPLAEMKGGQLLFKFRRANYLMPTVMFEVQFSHDCMDWTPAPPDSIVRNVNAPCTIEAAHLLAKIPGGGQATYVRLAILGL
jgi:hypothetical protein